MRKIILVLKPKTVQRFLFITFLCLNSCTKSGTNPINEEVDDSLNPFNLKLESEFADTRNYTVITDDIFAVWWDKSFDYKEDSKFMFETLKNIRQDCLNSLGMQDPPNVKRGVFFNVYIHHNESDNLPNDWANGVGTNSFDLPYMTLPSGAHIEFNNLLHEGFHIFQYSSNSPGFEYSGDTGWYTEATAEWYAVTRNPGAIDIFVAAETITSNPHLALWHSFDNEAPNDSTDWLYQVRQYAMQAWLYYMTNEESVAQNLITDGFYGNITKSPQEYHYKSIGSDRIRTIFANWAARNTLDFDYLTREQVERAKEELNNVADLTNRRPYAIALTNANLIGTHNPPERLKPRGWAYNVIQLNDLEPGSYTFKLAGDDEGSEGVLSHFEGRYIVEGKSQVDVFDMENATQGTFQLNLNQPVEESYIIVASVPESFSTFQNYGYTLEITQE